MNVVLACGLQKAYLSPKGSRYLGERSDVLRVRLKDYLSSLNKSSHVVYVLRELHRGDDSFYSHSVTHSTVGTKDIQIPDEFKPHIKMIIDINRYSGFHMTPLNSELSKIKPQKVFILGFETHTNVLFTAEELRNRLYDTILLEPLTTSEDDYMHSLGVTMMSNFLSVQIRQE